MKRKLRMTIAFLLSASLLAGCANLPAGVNTPDNVSHHSIEEKNVPFYNGDAEHKEDI